MMLDMESVLTAVDIMWTNEIGHRCQIQETEIQKQVAGAFTTRKPAAHRAGGTVTRLHGQSGNTMSKRPTDDQFLGKGP